MPRRLHSAGSSFPTRLARRGRLFTCILTLLLFTSAPAWCGQPAGDSLRPASARKGPRGGPPIPATLIELDGSISSSPDGAELSYQWRQVSGPDVTLSDATVAKPHFRTNVPGIYVFELVVSANGLDSEPHVVQLEIEAENLPPVAKVPRELTGQVGKPIEVDGSDSFDPEGEELAYRWRPLTPGLGIPAEELRNPVLTFKPTRDGVFEVELIVSDGELKSDPVVCRLTIKPKPVPPVARARVVTLQAPPEPSAPGNTMPPPAPVSALAASINAAASAGEDDDAPQPEMVRPPVAELAAMVPPSFPARSEPPAAPPSVPPPAPSPAPPATPAPALPLAPVSIEVARPVARIQGPTQAEAGKAVVLDARSSFAPSGNRMDYRWLQRAGAIVENRELVFDGAAERFVVPMPSEYEFELVVVDKGVESEPVTHRLQVQAAPEPPVAVVSAPTHAVKGELVRMDAMRSSDPGGARLIYRWRQTGGPPVRNYVIDDNLGDAAPGFHPPAPGTYSFELVVSNGTLNSMPAEVDIVVGDAIIAASVSIAGPRTARMGERVALDAIPDNTNGRTLSYLWQQVDGPALAMPQGGGMRAFVVPPMEGHYVFTLTALENGQAVASAVSTLDVYRGANPAAPRGMAAPPVTGRVPELTPLPNTPTPRAPPLESFPRASIDQRRPAAQVMQSGR